MKRKWQITVALVLSLVILLTAVPAVMAQDDEPQVAASIARGGSLAIIAPWTVPAGREFTVRAFLRENQEPFPNAGIWAVRQNADGTLKEDLSWLREDAEQSDENRDYESILNAHAVFLGRTGRDGRLACTFDEPGRYILVAARNGYRPGFTHIGIRDTVKALGIRAQQRAPAGRPVTMMVFDRVIHEPVKGAGVWAISRDEATTLRDEIAALRKDDGTDAAGLDYESIVSLYGTFLGRTDEHGKLSATFDTAGVYILVAVKRGYLPGFTILVVKEAPELQPQSIKPDSLRIQKDSLAELK